MPFSSGVLQSTQELFNIVAASHVKIDEFPIIFSRIGVANAAYVLKVSQECGWMQVNEAGILILTVQGERLHNIEAEDLFFKELLADLIVLKSPAWSKRITLGRKAINKFAPGDALQCLRDCGLLDGHSAATVKWWDKLSAKLRSVKDEGKLVVGRSAEELSLIYEKQRTGKDPIWFGFETSTEGFDVLSRISNKVDEKIRIEVKGTSQSLREARFILTRHEWETATSTTNYFFHLWVLKGDPKCFIVPADQVFPHVPLDQNDGDWKNAGIPFKIFSSFEVKIPNSVLSSSEFFAELSR